MYETTWTEFHEIDLHELNITSLREDINVYETTWTEFHAIDLHELNITYLREEDRKSVV